MNCSTCGAELIEVLPGDNCKEQLDNVLVLEVQGGYGMFTDEFIDFLEGKIEKPSKFFLCHDCAHKFCDAFDPQRKIIDPHFSHSHDGRYGDEH